MKKLTFSMVASAAAAFWLCLFAAGHFGCSTDNAIDPDSGGHTAADAGKPAACTPNLQCRNTLDCGSGTCNGGVCKCGSSSLCYANTDCGTGKCCNLLANSCYDCGGGGDDALTDTTGTPDTGPKDAGPDTGVDTGGQDTGSTSCTSDFQCPGQVCNTAMGVCVDCLRDTDCSTHGGGTCNMTTFSCSGGGNDAGQDTGVGQDAGDDAGTDPCALTTCLCDSYCMVQGGTPSCVSGCRNGNDCCGGKNCVNGSCVASTCGTDADCSGGAQPHCNTSTGACVECVYDSHCANGYTCDQTSNICVQGSGCNPPCGANEYCDQNTLTCMTANPKLCQPCTSFVDCLGGGEVLSCGMLTKVCTKQCMTDLDCPGSTCGMLGYCCT